MGDLGALGRERLVVELAGGHRVQRQVELVAPAELEARLGDRVVPLLGGRMPARQVGRVRRDPVRDHAILDVIAIGEAEVLLRRDVAEHRRAVPADHRRADRARDVVVARRDVGRERPERVERRLVAPLELLRHVLLDEVHGNVARPLVHDLHVVLPRDPVQLALGAQLGELGLVVGVRDRARAQTVAERERDVVLAHDLAELAEVGVEEVLLVMRHAPLGQDRAAARHDAGDPVDGQGHVAQQHARVHGEVVHALLALLDDRVAVNLPGQFLGHAADLLERLVDGHGADRHGGIADDPLARRVDVPARGQVHDRVGAPERRPAQLLHLLVDRRRHHRVPDVGVDLHLEAAPDDHRLEFGVVDVGGDDRAAARHLVTHEARVEAFADRDELHLRRDLAAPRVVHLRDGAVAAARGALEAVGQFEGVVALAGREGGAAAGDADVPGGDPGLAEWRQAFADIEAARAARVVDAQGRLAARERDLPHGDADAAGAVDVDAGGVGEGVAVRDGRGAGGWCGGGWGGWCGGRQCAGRLDHRDLDFSGRHVVAGWKRPASGGIPPASRAPYAGISRIRFWGSLSIPVSRPVCGNCALRAGRDAPGDCGEDRVRNRAGPRHRPPAVACRIEAQACLVLRTRLIGVPVSLPIDCSIGANPEYRSTPRDES